MSDWPEIRYQYRYVGKARLGAGAEFVDLVDEHARQELQHGDLLFVQRVVENERERAIDAATSDVIAAARKLHLNTRVPPHHLNDCTGGLSEPKCDCGYTDLSYALRRLERAASSRGDE